MSRLKMIMRIFKKEFNEELTDGMLINECIITKVDDTQYGNFIVHKKEKEGSFPFIAVFGTLRNAMNYAIMLEEPRIKYDYCTLLQNKDGDARRIKLGIMGVNGWELCAIDSNIDSDFDGSLYIYKRPAVIPNDSNSEDYPKDSI